MLQKLTLRTSKNLTQQIIRLRVSLCQDRAPLTKSIAELPNSSLQTQVEIDIEAMKRTNSDSVEDLLEVCTLKILNASFLILSFTIDLWSYWLIKWVCLKKVYCKYKSREFCVANGVEIFNILQAQKKVRQASRAKAEEDEEEDPDRKYREEDRDEEGGNNRKGKKKGKGKGKGKGKQKKGKGKGKGDQAKQEKTGEVVEVGSKRKHDERKDEEVEEPKHATPKKQPKKEKARSKKTPLKGRSPKVIKTLQSKAKKTSELDGSEKASKSSRQDKF